MSDLLDDFAPLVSPSGLLAESPDGDFAEGAFEAQAPTSRNRLIAASQRHLELREAVMAKHDNPKRFVLGCPFHACNPRIRKTSGKLTITRLAMPPPFVGLQ